MDYNLIEASHSLGASGTTTFFKIILPQLIPAIIGASLLTFMASMASFSAPFIFGGSVRFLTTEIYSSKVNGDFSLAASLSVLLTLISVLFLFILRWYRSRISFVSSSKGVKRKYSEKNSSYSLFYFFMVLIFIMLIILPGLALIYLAILPEGSLMRGEISGNYTASNFINLFTQADIFDPVLNSFSASSAAVLITVIVGLSSAFLITKVRNKLSNAIELFISIPYGIPGTVIAIGLILSFNFPNVFSAFTVLIGTFWILPLAYAVRNLPIVAQSSVSGFQSLDPSLEEASSTLGAGSIITFIKITLPVIFPTVLHGALLVFINSMGEFVSTILLYTYSTKTISVEIYSQLRLYNNGIAAAYGVLLFLIVMIILYISRRYFNSSQPF
jgi:iron(III) transport system permease protein